MLLSFFPHKLFFFGKALSPPSPPRAHPQRSTSVPVLLLGALDLPLHVDWRKKERTRLRGPALLRAFSIVRHLYSCLPFLCEYRIT